MIVLNAGWLAGGGEDPAAGFKAHTAWRDSLVAEKGTQFYEDCMNGYVNLDGTPTEEAIRAEEDAARRNGYYG